MRFNIALFFITILPAILVGSNDSTLLLISKSTIQGKFSGIVACYNFKINKYLFLNSSNLAIGANKSIDTNTLFNIGSISKVYTGILIYNAILDKRISLESKVSEILKNEQYGDVKIKHLLTHTSGFSRLESELNPKKIPKIVESNLRYIQLMYSKEKFKNATESKYIYSNHNYHLLAVILESIYNKEYVEILGDYLRLIGAHKSKFIFCFPETEIVADPLYLNKKLLNYNENETLRKFIAMDSTYGSGKIYTNISELVLFATHILKDNKLMDSFFLPTPNFIKSFKPNRTYLMEYATLSNNDTLYYHAGNAYGYNAIFGINLKKGNIYIVLSNIDSQLKDRNTYENIFKSLIDEY
jgi:hypothetical protein